MANPFLSNGCHDIETALLLEKAYQHDIGRAVAYTDGSRVFINTDDNLFNLLPDYNHGMLKWLLWHEEYHKQLKHHNRFFRYLKELTEAKTFDEFRVTKDEVNIIMDILVHDSLSKLFPELIETATNNLAQMRDRNSLSYTFKTNTLEEMLDEYAKHKHGEDDEDDGTSEGESDTTEDKEDKKKDESKGRKHKSMTPPDDMIDDTPDTSTPTPKDKSEDDEITTDPTTPPEPAPATGKHDETDWSKLEDINTREFIDKDEGDKYIYQINKLKRTKLRLAQITQTLNSLATTSRQRSYAMPSTIRVGNGVMLKGTKPGKTALFLCFDASGSMSCEMDMFKEIISKSIPQAMKTPTRWFSGWGSPTGTRDSSREGSYYKGTFEDFMKVSASSGYDDDGDRTIELCWEAEQKGYSPIGITDGGGQLSWSKDKLKQLKRTVLVGDSRRWLNEVKEVNPKVQVICTSED